MPEDRTARWWCDLSIPATGSVDSRRPAVGTAAAAVAGRIVAAMSTAAPGPVIGGFAAVPAHLHATRPGEERAAQALAEVARSLTDLSLPTGRADTGSAGAELLRQLSLAVHAAAVTTQDAGSLLGSAAALYAAVDRAACRS